MIEKIQDKLNRIKQIDSNKLRKKVAILGAGMAGLTAAYELSELGHEVVIYEANDRVGGRAWTHRFSDDQYHEFGAMRFPKEHDHTRYYAHKCGLKFQPFINHHDDGDTLYFLKGVLSKHSDWDIKLLPELNLTESEKFIIHNGPIPHQAKHKQLLNLLVFPLEGIIHEIMSNPDDFYSLLGMRAEITQKIKDLDGISFGDFLGLYLKSKDSLELIGGITGLEVWWDKAVTMFIREEIVARERIRIQELEEIKPDIEEIENGTDNLPKGIYQKLKDSNIEIQFKKKIFSLNNQKGQIQLGIEDESENRTLVDFEYVICTIPFSILRRIKLAGFSKEKMSSIRNLNYASSTKVLLNTKTRFWETSYNIIGGASQLDLINRQVYYPSNNIKVQINENVTSPFKSIIGQFSQIEKTIKNTEVSEGPGVLVGSYCWGQDARRLGGLDRKERAKAVIDAISNIHPEILEESMVKAESYEASIFWDEYKFAGGAFCFMKPGDFSNYYSDTIKSEGNLFFAGEHCSLDQGWIQGAIISSLRAVEEVVQK